MYVEETLQSYNETERTWRNIRKNMESLSRIDSDTKQIIIVGLNFWNM